MNLSHRADYERQSKSKIILNPPSYLLKVRLVWTMPETSASFCSPTHTVTWSLHTPGLGRSLTVQQVWPASESSPGPTFFQNRAPAGPKQFPVQIETKLCNTVILERRNLGKQ